MRRVAGSKPGRDASWRIPQRPLVQPLLPEIHGTLPRTKPRSHCAHCPRSWADDLDKGFGRCSDNVAHCRDRSHRNLTGDAKDWIVAWH